MHGPSEPDYLPELVEKIFLNLQNQRLEKRYHRCLSHTYRCPGEGSNGKQQKGCVLSATEDEVQKGSSPQK